MKSKEVYNNRASRCWVEFDGEILIINQWRNGERTNSIYLYEDEFSDVVEFVNEVNK